jgi:casein kinase II subunit beta
MSPIEIYAIRIEKAVSLRTMQPLIWVDRFLSLPSSQYLVRVADGFLTDFLSRPCLPETVADADSAKSLILDPDRADDAPAEPDAEILYGLAHAAFLRTADGRALLQAKVADGVFPTCPRVFCQRTTCLPCGVGLDLRDNPVRMFCPRCREIYKIGNSKVCGAFFGIKYIDEMIGAYPELASGDPAPVYVPRIFGFRILEPS